MNTVATVYDQAVARLAGGPRIVCAYHGNVDSIHQLTRGSLDNAVAAASASGATAAGGGMTPAATPAVPPSGRLASAAGVTAALLWCLQTGNGGEWQLADVALQAWVEACFPGVDSLGGTSAIAANHLAGLGYRPVLHAPSRGTRLMSLLHPGVQLAQLEPSGAGAVLVDPGSHARPQETDPVHVIVQFNRGDRFGVNGTEIVCPQSNRVIFSNDEAAARLPIDPAFCRWVSQNGAAIAGGVWCGYNLLDPAVLCERLAQIEVDVAAARAGGSRSVHHFESSDARNPEVQRVMLGSVLHNRPSVGMNEEEFATLCTVYAIDRVSGTDPGTAVEGLTRLAQRLNAATLVLHTARWAMAVSRSADPGELAVALAGGCAVAALRARTAEFATPDRLQAVVAAAGPVGGVQPGRARAGDHTAVWVPALDIGSPICTIGLGDSFVAGFVAASVQ